MQAPLEALDVGSNGASGTPPTSILPAPAHASHQEPSAQVEASQGGQPKQTGASSQVQAGDAAGSNVPAGPDANGASHLLSTSGEEDVSMC